jgi:hypothetical protein
MNPPFNIAKYIAVVIYVGAARHDAQRNPDRLAELRSVVIPALQDYREHRINEIGLRRAVRRVMGDDWHPTGEWEVCLRSLEG